MKHPNIVKYFDCFMDPNYLIIIMEYCNAGDLTGMIKAQAGQLLPEKHIMFFFVQVSQDTMARSGDCRVQDLAQSNFCCHSTRWVQHSGHW
jgi:serine/threonine protein kinase